jgi:hypothetical protein
METNTAVLQHGADQTPQRDSALQVKPLIEHAAHLLPVQGRTTVFIYYNALHAYGLLALRPVPLGAHSPSGMLDVVRSSGTLPRRQRLQFGATF